MAIALATTLLACVPALHAQGSRKDDIVFGPAGHPVSGATVRVCQAAATGTPCTPLATLYTDTTLTVTAANPLQTDGIGNYHFYAPAGRYQIQISSPQITGTLTQQDVILPPDVPSSSSPNNISAFGLTLGGNLNVAGNASISGTLTASNLNPGSLSPASLNVLGNSSVAGPRPYIDITSPQYGAIGDGGAEQATGAIAAGSHQLTIVPSTGTWKVGMGVHVDGASASGDVLLAHVTAIAGNVFTLDTAASTTVTAAGVQDDDTLAIQGALNNYCTTFLNNYQGGTIYFPPGVYIYSQPQSVNPTAIPFQNMCEGVHYLGGNSGQHPGTPFISPPSVSILAHCGASPNAQPAFGVYYPWGNVTFENLVINGCNIAVEVTGNVVRFLNAMIAANGGGTNGSAVHLQDTFWDYFSYGGLTTSNKSIPTLLMTGTPCSGCYAGVGDVYMENALLAGGPIQYIQQGNLSGEPSGHWVFRNITQESANTDFLQILDPGSYSTGIMGPITLDDAQQSDNSNPSAALINANLPVGGLSGVYVNNSFSGAGGVNAPAILMTAGTIDHYEVLGGQSAVVTQVWNSSGKPVGNGVMENWAGFDFTSDVTSSTSYGRLNTSPFSNENISNYGPVARFIQSGNSYASYGIDAANGWMFGSNTQAGWNAQIFQSTAPNIDVAFAGNYPPTGLSGTVSNTGGAFTTGNYYFWVVSNTNGSCGTSGGMSAPSAIFGPLTVGAGITTASVTLTWTPAAAGLIPLQGYCVFVNILPQYNFGSPCTNLIAGSGATGTTLTTAAPNTPGYYPITYQMVQAHHFTPTAAFFNGISTPGPGTGSPPYTPACIATAGCGTFLPLSPVDGDTFTRANNTANLGANWANNFDLMQILGNAAASLGGGSGYFGVASYVGQNFNADQWSRATVKTITSGGATYGVGVTVRTSGSSSSDTDYLYYCTGTERFLSKRVSGSGTNVATVASGCNANDVIEIDVAGNSLTAIYNGAVDMTYTDASSPIAAGAPGVSAYNTGTASADTLANWIGGSLAVGNATTSIFNQPNTWTQPQKFASPLTSASLAVPNKTRTCSIIRGDQSGSALTTGNIQPQGSLCYVDAASTVAQVIVMVDAGISTMQLGYRHNGSTMAISPTLTPASVTGITDHVACANAGGTSITVEGNSVTCSTLTNTALTAGDFVETIGGAADGTSKRMSIAMTFMPN